MTISFTHNNSNHKLSGSMPTAYAIFSPQLCKDVASNEVYSMFDLCTPGEDDDTTSLPTLLFSIESILHDYTALFDKPSGLPPTCDTDLGLSYNLGRAQTLSKPSHSPFSSPILQVHKKDGS